MREKTRVERLRTVEPQRSTRSNLHETLAHPSQGQSLDTRTESHLSQQLGHSLSSVHIHNDGEADQLATSVGARAFTTGEHVYFKSGQYQPDTLAGHHLLAHEMTHVIQQENGVVAGSEMEPGVFISERTDPFEREAANKADAALLGRTVGTRAMGGGDPGNTTDVSIQREDDDMPWDSGLWRMGESLASLIPGPVGTIARTVRAGLSGERAVHEGSEGNTAGAVQQGLTSASSLLGGLASLGGFSALGPGGLAGAGSALLEGGLGALGTVGGIPGSALTMEAGAALAGGGGSGLAALGPAGMVLGAGAAGVGIGTLIAENTGVDEAIGDGLYDLLGPGPGLWLADTFGI